MSGFVDLGICESEEKIKGLTATTRTQKTIVVAGSHQRLSLQEIRAQWHVGIAHHSYNYLHYKTSTHTNIIIVAINTINGTLPTRIFLYSRSHF